MNLVMILAIIINDDTEKELAVSFANAILQKIDWPIIKIINKSNGLDDLYKFTFINEVIDIAKADTTKLYTDNVIKSLLKDNHFPISDYIGNLDTKKLSYCKLIGIDLFADDIQSVVDIILPIIEYNDNIEWINDSKGWKYLPFADGNLIRFRGLQTEKKLYFIDNERYMQTGWQNVYIDEDDTTYRLYFDPTNGSGALLTGWNKIDGTWYYFYDIYPFIRMSSVSIGGINYNINQFGALVDYNGEEVPPNPII